MNNLGVNDLLTVTESALFLRLRPSTIRAWILRRRIPYVKLGGRVCVRRADLEALIAASVVPVISNAPCDAYKTAGSGSSPPADNSLHPLQGGAK
jgi:excisionase family DNA binding protein